jgi:hypothetical protein
MQPIGIVDFITIHAVWFAEQMAAVAAFADEAPKGSRL